MDNNNYNDSTLFFREIKSYVLRGSRISLSQKEAIMRLFNRWGIDYQSQEMDLNLLFGRERPKALEIGFGMGASLLQMAQKRPDIDYLGIEVHRPGVGQLLYLMEQEGVNNIRVICHDAVEVIDHMLSNNSLDEVHIYFPDPWPKKRHHKRRLIQGPFIERLSKKIKVGGRLYLATDWQNYAEQMLAVLMAESSLRNTTKGFSQRHEERPITKFESRGSQQGHAIWDLIFEKIEPNSF